MKKFFLLTLAACLALACSSGKSQSDLPETKPEQTTPVAKEATVVTGDASDITSTSALIAASYADAPSQGVYDRGVFYGLAAYDLKQQAGLNSDTATSGSFSVQLSSLEPGTTYYYQAYITVWNEADKKYVDVTGAVKNFTTSDGESGGEEPGGEEQTADLQYLGGYEMPAIDLKDDKKCSGYGPETLGDANWFNYLTNNENQMVVTHTYNYQGKQYRNWTALIDKDKQSPLWSAFVMHKEAYPSNSVGRWNSWTPDPAIPATWQRSVASSSYSRGHFCASEYRQTVLESANAQTFYYTNQTLQEQNGFNGSVWASLEQAVSAHAPSGRDTLYVVVGVLFEDPNKIISTNQGTQALAASHFYKCLMKCSFDASGAMTAANGCAYLFTNEAHSGNYSQGLTSIDAIEQRSGWDFYTNVPKELQDAAEKQSTSLW